MVAGGEVLSVNGEDIGIVNSPCFSHRMNKSLALAHVSPSVSVGSVLTVKGDGIVTTATVIANPVYDPNKSKTHA
jgi:aminomethyltransferase